MTNKMYSKTFMAKHFIECGGKCRLPGQVCSIPLCPIEAEGIERGYGRSSCLRMDKLRWARKWLEIHPDEEGSCESIW